MNALFVFLLLLFIFILATAIFSENNSLQMLKNVFRKSLHLEGMISYMQDVTDSNSISKSGISTIPVYSSTSKTIIKLHDNIFYDLKNANLIEVDGTKLNTEDISEDNGVSINGIYVIKRNSTVSSKYMNIISCNGIQYSGSVDVNKSNIGGNNKANCAVVTADVNESLILEVVKSYEPWYYITKSTTTDTYYIVYIPYDVITFVHIISVTTKQHLMTYGIVDNTYVFVSTFNKNFNITVADYTEYIDNNDDNTILEDLYSSTLKVYQMSHYVKFDITSGYLIIKSSATTITVYDRYGQVVSNYLKNIPTNIVKTSFGSWVVPDSANNMVLYISLDNFTAIAIIGYDTKKSSFVLRKVKCFGNYQNKIITSETKSSSSSSSTTTTTKYSNSSYFDDDYILKTQIVPPVCPKCPSCCNGKSGVCSNCGGHGGSGVIHSSEHALNDIGRGIEHGVRGTVDLAEDVGSGLASGVRGTADLVGDLGSDVVSGVRGTADLVGDLGSGLASGVRGTADLVGDLGSGAVSGLRDLSTIGNSSIVNNKYINYNMPQPQNNYLQQAQAQQQNIINTYKQPPMGSPNTIPGVDPYSYYGALVPKGGNGDYMPVMSDFSTFGK